MSKEKIPFEAKIKRLEEIVEKLEADDVSLEEHVALYQEGIILSKECDNELKKVEEKITVILEENGESTTKEIDESELRD